MKTGELNDTARALVAPAKGILAADESTNTITRRFDSINVESTEQNRRDYRELLFRTPGANEFISGVILYDETLRQRGADGTPIVSILQEQAGYESQQILQDAQRKAYRIVSEAENVALARRDGADSYAREVLFNLEEQLADILGQVRRGIDALNLEVEASKRKQQQNSVPVNGSVASENGVAVV